MMLYSQFRRISVLQSTQVKRTPQVYINEFTI